MVLMLMVRPADAQQSKAPAAAAKPAPAPPAMELSDQPHFSIAGVTDWTAAGGHGSDTTLRTSESLAKATAALAPELTVSEVADPVSAERSARALQQRLAAEKAEAKGDPLTAVRDLEQAASLDPSEQNEFEWGSLLLLHRAIWQAEKVFRNGVALYPSSMRMQTGLGSALFAGARYADAADHLCAASDLDPMGREPYHLLGKIQIAAPNPLPCISAKLERFVRLYPQDADAYYLDAMAILKDTSGADSTQRATALLQRAIAVDANCSDAYLELGILASERRNYTEAIRLYGQAIRSDPQSADAHYRLAVAYDRIGQSAKAQSELALHDRLKQQQAAAVEDQRKALKQFVFSDASAPIIHE